MKKTYNRDVKIFMKRIFLLAATMVILVACFYYGNNQSFSFQKFEAKFGYIYSLFQKPCSQPIAYSLGTFDTRFGLSKSQFLAYIADAEKAWETAAGKNIFDYSATGSLKVNLVYDDRQKVTDELKSQGVSIDNSKATYDALKSKYEIMQSDYESQKTAYEKLFADFKAKQSEYEKQVDYWNTHGGAPKKEYADLEAERQNLMNEQTQLNDMRDTLVREADKINALASILNSLAQSLNLNIQKYNTTTVANGDLFSEGEYVEDANGKRINIYQFDDKNRLIRVLEHELGHALGLEHVADPNAVMYYLNSGKNIALSQADIDALKNTCWYGKK